jgi:hypothetical protein
MSKINENDKKILELKQKIEAKKKKLGNGKFIPITNCSIELDGQRYNIQVLAKEQLTLLLIKMNMYKMSAVQLEEEDILSSSNFSISGYDINSWLSDISSRLEVLSQKDEEKKLKDLETTLHQLLSSDKQTEIKLQNIEDLLK